MALNIKNEFNEIEPAQPFLVDQFENENSKPIQMIHEEDGNFNTAFWNVKNFIILFELL